MTDIINYLNDIQVVSEDNLITKMSENELENESENELENESENESENKVDNILFLLKINDRNICYCNDTNEVNKALKYVVNKLTTKYLLEGYNVYKFDEKWIVLDKNKISSKLYGSKPNSILFYDNMLSNIEIELVLKYNQDLFSDNIKIL